MYNTGQNMNTVSPIQFRHHSAANAQKEQPSKLAYAWQLAKRPVEWMRYACLGTSQPSSVLNKISVLAKAGIQLASGAGIRYESRSADLNGEIERALSSQGIGSAPSRIAEVGEVANLGPNRAPDPEITLPLRMQDQTELLTTRNRQQELLATLLEKLSVFTTLVQMRNRAGIKEDTNLKILALVKQATEGPNQISVWQLFTKTYELSFFQTLLAGWFYWVYYMTSLINNTINAYVPALIKNITEKLTTESDKTRQILFERLITNADEFLNADRMATQRYANDQEGPNLKEVRDKAIKKEYGDLITLCQDFSISVVQNDPPPVGFFRGPQEIPVIGTVFSLFEWLVNRFIIQRAMMYSILPDVFKDGVEQGLEAIKGNPFAIAMTEFFTSQLEKFKATLESNQPMDQDATLFPGNKKLPKIIKDLLQVLDLEGDYTVRELRQKFEKSAKSTDGHIVTQIQEGIVTGVNALFAFLNESMQSGELFTNLLELSLLPFEGEEKSQAALTAAYEAQCIEFKKTARDTLQLLTQKAISGHVNGDQQKYLAATQALSAQKVVLDVLVPKLGEICERLERKIASSQNGSTEANSIHGDLIDLFQTLQVLSTNKELQDELGKLDGTHRNEIWRRIVPLHKKAKKIAERLLPLQELQNSHLRLSSATTQLSEASDFLTRMRERISDQSRCLQNLSIPLLDQAAIKLSKALGADAPVPLGFKERIRSLDDLSQAVAQEQNALNAIYALYPSRASSEEGDGLLDQTLKFQRGERLSEFSPRDCMARIAKTLEFFPKDEQSQSEKRELDALIGDGTRLQSRWLQLSLTLQSIYARRSHLKNTQQATFNETLREAQDWVNQKTEIYRYLKDQDHQKMREIMTGVSSEMAALSKSSSQLTGPLSRPLSRWIWTVLPSGLGYAGYPGIGALISGGFFKWWYSSSDASEELSWSSVIQKGVVAAVPAAIKSYTMWNPLPGIDETINQGLNAALGAAFGYSAINTGRSGFETYTFNKVWEIFEKAYDFSLDQRVYSAATTRLMREMIRSRALTAAAN